MRPSDIPTAQEFQSLRQFLLDMGFTQQQVGRMVGVAASNRTALTIARSIRNELKTLPKRTG